MVEVTCCKGLSVRMSEQHLTTCSIHGPAMYGGLQHVHGHAFWRWFSHIASCTLIVLGRRHTVAPYGQGLIFTHQMKYKRKTVSNCEVTIVTQSTARSPLCYWIGCEIIMHIYCPSDCLYISWEAGLEECKVKRVCAMLSAKRIMSNCTQNVREHPLLCCCYAVAKHITWAKLLQGTTYMYHVIYLQDSVSNYIFM